MVVGERSFEKQKTQDMTIFLCISFRLMVMSGHIGQEFFLALYFFVAGVHLEVWVSGWIPEIVQWSKINSIHILDIIILYEQIK